MRIYKLCVLLGVAACNADPQVLDSLGDTGTPTTSADDADDADDGVDGSTAAVDDGEASGGMTDDGPAGPYCGNDIIDGDDFCDGTDLAGYTCEVLGFETGELGCTVNCGGHDLTGCGFFECGNGREEGDEDCDGTVGDATCATEGFDNGTLFCTPECEYNVEQCGTCGDRVVSPGEDCDIAAPLEDSCQSLGLLSGTLQCGDDCLFDLTNCSTCGNGMAEGTEDCDTDDLMGMTCASEGYDSGVLTCQNNCTLDFGADCGLCGNGDRDGTELCDGADFGFDSCVSEGFDNGLLLCNAECDGISTENCGICGNGDIENGEGCDGLLLDGETCLSQGFDSGTIVCADDCQFDTAGCGVCGNALVDGDEICDTGNFGGETCVTQGFDNGTLSCNGTCDTVSTAGCGVCGNALVDGSEACDGANLGGETCGTLGLGGGTLGCSATCQYDFLMCDIPGGSLLTVRTTDNTLVAIDTMTLAMTDVGPLGTDFDFGEVAWDSTSGTLWMIDGRPLEALFTVDLGTGAATLVGVHAIDDLFGLAHDPTTGTLYGSGESPTGFYSLNQATGAATFIGDPGVAADGLTYDSTRDQVVGLAAGGPLNLIDRATGAPTLLSNEGFVNNCGLAYDPFDDLYWAITWSGSLYSYDPTTGYSQTLLLSGLGAHDGLTFVPGFVP